MKENYTIYHSTRLEYIRLDMNENNWGPSPETLDIIHNLKPEDISVYPEKNELLDALAQKLEVEVGNILFGNGSDELIDLITRTYITEGTHIILPIPTFSMFEICFKKKSSQIEKIEYEKDLSYPTSNVLAAIKDRTGIIVVVSPNNPTGTTLPRNHLIRILESAPSALVIVDEAYADFAGTSCLELVKTYQNLIVLRTFSKSYGLAGLRLGYAVSSQKIIDRMRSYQMPFNINNIALRAAMVAINADSTFCKMRMNLMKEKSYLISALQSLKIPVRDTEANFIIAYTGLWTDELHRSLKKNRILVRNLKDYSLLESCLRITVGTPEENVSLIHTLQTIISRKLIIFDMDGVLVNTRESYDGAIKETVYHFTSKSISDENIWDLRNKGNYNNDWLLTHDLIRGCGQETSFKQVKKEFQSRFIGNDFNGLILREEWCADLQLLEKLSTSYTLAIFTGRPRREAMFTLEKNNALKFFSQIITYDDLADDEQKPNPKGIERLISEQSAELALYVGDTVDDIAAALSAGITPILCTSNIDLARKIKITGCRFVSRTINEIMGALL